MWRLKSNWMHARSGGWLLGLALSVLLMAGCDSRGTEQASRYQTLTGGYWEVTELRVDGTDLGSQVDQRYRSVRFEFSGGDGEPRTYKILGVQEADTLQVQGGISLPGPDLLTMLTGFGRPVTWTFNLDQPDELSTSVRFRLPRSRQVGSEAFLNTLLPGQGWGEEQGVRLDLLFQESASPNER